jgi:hypothetical protein
VRDRTHWNSPNIKPRHPVEIGLCSFAELERALSHARARRPVQENSLGDEKSERVEG